MKTLFSKEPSASLKKITKSIHGIEINSIPKFPLKILKILILNGFESYIVGGSLRDKILNLRPKDFDIATKATPEQIKKLIPRSRIIGRRFKLVHVRHGKEIIEVATFRAANKDNLKSNEGMVIRDNKYGSSLEDALRRDFTMNSLFYDIETEELLDYTGGYKDLLQKKVKVIGDTETRFKEDPIRMLRAVRFSSKLNFQLNSDLISKINKLGHLLLNIPTARRLDEVKKLFLNGYAYKNAILLNETNLLEFLFPSLKEEFFKKNKENYLQEFIKISLQETDKRFAHNKPVMLPFLMATLLWPALIMRMGEINSPNIKIPNLRNNARKVIKDHSNFCSIPKRMEFIIIEIWEYQIKLLRTKSPKAIQLISHARFRAAYDFLINREKAGSDLGHLGDWWTKFKEADYFHKKKMIKTNSFETKKPKSLKKRLK